VIRGRRRIGKSRLAEEFSKSFSKSYILTGIPPDSNVTAKSQIDEFSRQLNRAKVSLKESEDWGDSFTDLALHCKSGKILIILDEITWMGSKDPTFLPKLKTIWDTYFKKNPQLILIISGSNSTWIEKNILSSTGFVGRISCQIHLKELPLHRCNEFWKSKFHLSPYEIFKLLAITGGVPRYLEEIRTDLTAEQNILNLCYKPEGILFNEFDQLFSDLFSSRNLLYKNIISQTVDQKPSLKDITHSLGKKPGGDFSEYLNELVESGFIIKDLDWNIKRKSCHLIYFTRNLNFSAHKFDIFLTYS